MSLFNDDKYIYWENKIGLIFALKSLNDTNPIPSIISSLLDRRAYTLFAGIVALYQNPDTEIGKELFLGIPMNEEDLRVFIYLLNYYYESIGSAYRVYSLVTSIYLKTN